MSLEGNCDVAQFLLISVASRQTIERSRIFSA